jgi:hypothetical protein
MRVSILTLSLFWLIAAALIYTSRHTAAPGLPHRHTDELTNWGQGRAPTPHQCPAGTTEFDVDSTFLECMRGTN